jgi:hypothetical protein
MPCVPTDEAFGEHRRRLRQAGLEVLVGAAGLEPATTRL